MAKEIKKNKPLLEDTPIAVPIEGAKQTESENTVAEGLKQVKNRYPGKWIPMTPEQVVEYTQNGLLFGYDPENGEGLLKEDK